MSFNREFAGLCVDSAKIIGAYLLIEDLRKELSDKEAIHKPLNAVERAKKSLVDAWDELRMTQDAEALHKHRMAFDEKWGVLSDKGS